MKRYYHILIISVLGIGAYACTPQQEAPVAEATLETPTQATAIVLTKNQKAAAGIELGQLEEKNLSERIHANGYFDVPPDKRAYVSAYRAGYVIQTSFLVGDRVQKGQVMALLENPEYIHLQQNYLEVKGQLDYLKSEYERKKTLAAENITAQKNLLKAEADYKTALAQVQGLQKELEMMGISIQKIEAGNITSFIAVRAPIEGVLAAVNVVLGKHVSPAEVMFEIVNTDHLHLELSVYEKDVLKVKEGQKLMVKIPSLGEETYQGDVYLVGKTFETDKRSINVHAHLQDEEEGFLPGMYVEATIFTGEKLVTAIPEEAVITEGKAAFIFVESAEKENDVSYHKVDVLTGLRSEGWCEVTPLKTLNADAKVVIKGAYYLSAEMEKEG